MSHLNSSNNFLSISADVFSNIIFRYAHIRDYLKLLHICSNLRKILLDSLPDILQLYIYVYQIDIDMVLLILDMSADAAPTHIFDLFKWVTTCDTPDDISMNEYMVMAIENNNCLLLDYLIKLSSQCGYISLDINCAINCAIKNGSFSCVVYFMSKTITSLDKDLIFKYSITSHMIDIIDYLINYWVDADNLPEYKKYMLNTAIRDGSLNMLQYVYKKFGIEILEQYDRFYNAIVIAAEFGHLYIIRYLIEDCHVYLDTRAFTTAANFGYYDIVKYLLPMIKLDSFILDDFSSCNNQILQYLIENGLNVASHATILINKNISEGHNIMVKYLISNGAKYTIGQHRCFLTSILHNNIEILKYLHKYADSPIKFTSLLKYSVIKKQFNILQYLIEAGAVPSKKMLKIALSNDTEGKDSSVSIMMIMILKNLLKIVTIPDNVRVQTHDQQSAQDIH